MRLFFRALRSFMKPGGLVKVSSSKGAVGVRFFYIMESAAENEFVHVETRLETVISLRSAMRIMVRTRFLRRFRANR